MNNIKAILFDLDGTLRLNLPTGGEVFLQYLTNIGMNYSVSEKLRVEHWEYLYFANSPEIKEDSLKFEGDFPGFWLNFSKRRLMAFGIPEARAIELAPHVSKHMNDHYKPKVLIPEEIPNVLTLLQEGGYVLGVVSNRETSFQEELQELKLDSYFNFTLSAGEAGSFKPDAPIFERALEMAGVSAEEAIYVGDNYFADIVGSKNAGLIPVLYDPTNIFPDAPDCHIIQSFNQLHDLLR
jgi:FMN phosphatase YigB (HAD superfamily)